MGNLKYDQHTSRFPAISEMCLPYNVVATRETHLASVQHMFIMYPLVTQRNAPGVSNLGTPGRLSHSSVVLLSRPTFTPDGVRCGRDKLTPARHGFNNAMQRRPGTAVGRKVSSPPCMTGTSALPLSSSCQLCRQHLRRPRQIVQWKVFLVLT